jgi:hypothetical protein
MFTVKTRHVGCREQVVPINFLTRIEAVDYVETMYFPLFGDGPSWEGNCVAIEDEIGTMVVTIHCPMTDEYDQFDLEDKLVV